MGSSLPWIIMAVGVLILILLLISIFVTNKRKKKYKTDYYNLFIIGIIWFVIGLPLDNSILWVLGLIFMVVGLIHKKDWKKNRRTWKDLDERERKWRFWIIIGVFIFFILGLIVLLLTKGG